VRLPLVILATLEVLD